MTSRSHQGGGGSDDEGGGSEEGAAALPEPTAKEAQTPLLNEKAFCFWEIS
jgi:hypothetical protein